MTSINTPARLAAVSLASVLALTACSSSSVVFDFTEASTEPAESIEFRIPDELLELNESYAETGVFESITVSAIEAKDPSECAVERKFEYIDGGHERLMEYLTSEGNEGESEKELMASLLLRKQHIDSVDVDDEYTTVSMPMKCVTSPTDTEFFTPVLFVQIFDEDGGMSSSDFAWANVTAMQGGELFAHDPEVKEWKADSNGNWIKS